MDALTALSRPRTRLADAARAVASEGRTDLVGAAGGSLALLCVEIARATGRRVVVLCHDGDASSRLAADVAFFAGASEDDRDEPQVIHLPAPDAPPYAETAADRAGEMARLAALYRISTSRSWQVLVAPAQAGLRRVVPRDLFARHCDLVLAEEELDREAFCARLVAAGYLRAPVVEDPGTFAVRGAILDLFVPAAGLPARIELYGDMVEAIRLFDPETQRGKRSIRSLFVHPVREQLRGPGEIARARRRLQALCDSIDMPTGRTRDLIDSIEAGRLLFGSEALTPAFYERLSPLTDYLSGDEVFVLEDPAQLAVALDAELERADKAFRSRIERAEPAFAPAEHYASVAELVGRATSGPHVMAHRLAVLGGEGWEAARQPFVDLGIEDNTPLAAALRAARAAKGREALGPLASRLRELTDLGCRAIVTAHTQTQADRLAALVRGFGCKVALAGPSAPRGSVEVAVGPLTRGFFAPADALAYVTEEEIFGPRVERRVKATRSEVFLEDLRTLAMGDLVVHAEHGIGRYLGLVRRAVSGVEIDFLLIEFAGGDKLYLPVYRLSQVQKYVGAEGAGEVRLDKLGGQTFALKKSRVSKAVREMADSLLKLYAERQALPGTPLPPGDDQYREFEASFPFTETPDQDKAIAEVVGDLEKPRPMDRLVCGDVGFGKTEVAMRAAFRAVEAGFQVAVLVPTTVLAQQHYQTFRDRMKDFAVSVDVLSRFRSRKEQEEVLLRLKEGKLDIVVGTHRLLSKDVHWKNLGLLVVDEEQRFGVAHKERIKALRSQVDVLTLTATPIPRTLHMAMAGLRDLSLIATPPPDRRAIRTFVSQMDENLVREAIERELARGGQVFYVYNRVQDIEEKVALVRRLVPRARIVVAHGQMAEATLEKAMTEFVAGSFDVLCATSIVESGLDIPRANTMIIDRADMMGLAQLYQLRGRIGRSRERAYCYLIVPPVGKMTDEARERVAALERFSALGSGFHIASLDLEIRGAGSLLGAEQSGQVAAVGFDLYCQMLEEAVAELRGTPVARDIEPELTFDLPGFLPDDYVPETGVRLSLYKRLSDASSEDEVYAIGEELVDRCGALPPEARMLLEIMVIKVRLRRLRALGIEASGERVTLHLREDTPLGPAKVLELVNRPGSTYRLTPDMRLVRRFAGQPGEGLANA
ncbi:MAG: transcription-repair coupling factor, partial [Deltaproteobacteria bacterium]|nr:transcription-repair coupling factor [Deltaproteobacteria bacterium]